MDAKTRPDAGTLLPDLGELRSAAPVGDAEVAALARRRPRGWLSPINRRRWENFTENRRGYWSFWIFMVLLVLSLGAEFIANDKPFYVRHDGRSYFPVFTTYSETAFGGEFETAADYRDPYLQKLIADKGGTILWPPIRYSYDTHNLDLPTPAPSPPTWKLTEEQCKPAAEKKGSAGCRDLEQNWLGTDDQGRDVVARMIYGFRISVLFGLALTLISSFIGVAAGAVQGYFGGWTDLLFQRFIEIWTSIPSLYLLLIISSVLVPGFFVLLGILLLVLVGLAGRARAGGIPAREQFRIHPGRARARRLQPHHHVPPSAAERHGRDDDDAAVRAVVVGDDADCARFPRLRPAAWIAVARRDAVAGQGQRARALARPDGLLHRGRYALAADLHRRGGARRLRSAQDVRVSMMDAASRYTLLQRPRSLRRVPPGRERVLAVDRISFDDQEGRNRRAGRRSPGSGKSVTALSVMKLLPYPAARASVGFDPRSRARSCCSSAERDIRHVRGNDITIIFQEPMTSLNPLHTIERQIARNPAAA